MADRWFNFRDIMAHIQSLGHTYCIRTKTNISISIDDFEYSHMISTIADIEPLFSKSKYFDSVKINSFNFPTKLAILWLTILGSDYSKNRNHFNFSFNFRISKSNY